MTKERIQEAKRRLQEIADIPNVQDVKFEYSDGSSETLCIPMPDEKRLSFERDFTSEEKLEAMGEMMGIPLSELFFNNVPPPKEK